VLATLVMRSVAPDILLFANLGAIQLNYGLGVEDCRRAVEMIQADALILHLNALQEAVQPEGDTRFAGLLDKIETVCNSEMAKASRDMAREASRDLHMVSCADAVSSNTCKRDSYRTQNMQQDEDANNIQSNRITKR